MATDPSPSCRKTSVGFSDGGGPKACASMGVPETSSFPRKGHSMVTARQRPTLEGTCGPLSDGGRVDQLLRETDPRPTGIWSSPIQRPGGTRGGGKSEPAQRKFRYTDRLLL